MYKFFFFFIFLFFYYITIASSADIFIYGKSVDDFEEVLISGYCSIFGNGTVDGDFTIGGLHLIGGYPF